MAKIYVTVRGGNVQCIFGPKGTQVVMLDYDNLDAMPEDDIDRDEFRDNQEELAQARKDDKVVHIY